MLAREDLQADVRNCGCWLAEESSLQAVLPEWILLGLTIHSQGGMHHLLPRVQKQAFGLQSATGRFVAAASLRALDVVNEQRVSEVI